MGFAHLRRHANLRFARISRSRARRRKKNAIREDSWRFAVRLLMFLHAVLLSPNWIESNPVTPLMKKSILTKNVNIGFYADFFSALFFIYCRPARIATPSKKNRMLNVSMLIAGFGTSSVVAPSTIA